MMVEQLGPYRIERELGHGGMGTVYAGLDRQTGRRAAVKLLAAPLARHEGFRERFEAEIETLKKLRHPNIVRLFGFGQQDDQLFYAMELIDGSSLEGELDRGRRFHWREVTRIGIQTCRALRHAHDRGVIHRDIKPGNLLMTTQGQVKLSDFGIARLFGNARLTQVGSVVGTAEYMSPEQAEGRPVSPRTDLYSLGAVLYALLAARPLFRAQSVPELLQKQRFERPDPLSGFAPDVPTALEQIIAQLLAKDPDHRVPNADLLARQLEAMERALSLRPDWEDEFAVAAERHRQGLRSEGNEVAAPDGPGGPSKSPPGGSGRSEPDELPPTRLAEWPRACDQRDVEHAAANRPSAPEPPPPAGDRPSVGHAQCPPDEMPETKATEAFKGLAPPEPDRPPKPSPQFTAVAEEELDRVETTHQPHALISLHTWALVAGLIAVGVGVWYFLQPPSRDTLYGRIAARADDETTASLLEAEDDIERFLSLYPEDPRCGQLREYQKEIELHRLERKFELRAKGLLRSDNLAPIEQAYLEAINYLRLDPERGMAKLQALLDLYDHRRDTSGPTGRCLELARRRLAQLRAERDEQTARHRALVEDRLDQAERLSRTEPERARAMYRAVIQLYQQKPWAAEAVRRARDALAAIGEKP